MDDCNLDKLAIKPGKLTPKFNKDITDYSVIVGSNVEAINFECLTSDSGASYCISVRYLVLTFDIRLDGHEN